MPSTATMPTLSGESGQRNEGAAATLANVGTDGSIPSLLTQRKE